MVNEKATCTDMQSEREPTIWRSYRAAFEEFQGRTGCRPLFLQGDAVAVLDDLPAESFDFCMTSPPYWGQRSYAGGGIGLEDRYEDYIAHLLVIFGKVQRVLKRSGSFWLNIGDAYLKKNLLGLPWRVALRLTGEQKYSRTPDRRCEDAGGLPKR